MSYLLRDARKRNWSWFERDATAKLSDANERSVYLALLELDYGSGLVYASQDTISKTSKVSLASVKRVLPRLEAKGLIERADAEALQELSEEIGRYPAAVVYILRNAEPEIRAEQPVERIAASTLVEKVRTAIADAPLKRRRGIAVGIIVRFLQQNGLDAPFGWLIRMWDQAFTVHGSEGAAAILSEAALITVKQKPGGRPMAYMNQIVLEKSRQSHLHMGAAKPRDLSQAATDAFKWED